MRSLRDVKRLVGRAGIHARPQVSKAVLDGLLKELAAGREDASTPARWRLWGSLVHDPVARVIAAAAMVCIVALAVVSFTRHPPVRQPTDTETPSPASLLTVGYLNAACRRGGLPEVERQCEQAAQTLRIQPQRVSMDQLIREMRGT
ncbi:MAG: hypothetical protein JW955_08575 [Sedimentisphaerales bacterium]|nr:hypothetical protein [Sedimentisphaerales bacterium]